MQTVSRFNHWNHLIFEIRISNSHRMNWKSHYLFGVVKTDSITLIRILNIPPLRIDWECDFRFFSSCYFIFYNVQPLLVLGVGVYIWSDRSVFKSYENVSSFFAVDFTLWNSKYLAWFDEANLNLFLLFVFVPFVPWNVTEVQKSAIAERYFFARN